MKVHATNRRVAFDYEIQASYTAGLILTGTQVKSIIDGRASLQDAHVVDRNGELFITGMTIAPAATTGRYFQHDPQAMVKLLLNRKEIDRILGVMATNHSMAILVKSVFHDGRKLKAEVVVGRGRKKFEKRDAIKAREVARDLREGNY